MKKTKNVAFSVVYGSIIIIAAWVIFLFVCKHTESREYPKIAYSVVEKMNVPVELLAILNQAKEVESEIPTGFFFLGFPSIQYYWHETSQDRIEKIYNISKSNYMKWQYESRIGGLILYSRDYEIFVSLFVPLYGGKESQKENLKIFFCPKGQSDEYIKLPNTGIYRQIIWTGPVSRSKDWVVKTFAVLVVMTFSLLMFYVIIIIYPWIKKNNYKL